LPKYIFDNLPFPPTVNKMYATVINPKFINWIRRGGNHRNPKGRPPQSYRILTKDSNAYKARMAQWAIFNSDIVKKASDKLKEELLLENKVIELRAYFCLPREQIWYKNGKFKKMDAANRLKALHDSLSDVLGIDDKYFYPGPSPKVILSGDRKSECVLVIMEPKPVMDWESLKSQEIASIASLQSIDGLEKKSS